MATRTLASSQLVVRASWPARVGLLYSGRVTRRVLCAIALLSVGLVAAAAARAAPPIHTVIGTVEPVGALDAPEGVTLVVRQSVTRARVTTVVPRPEVPVEYRGLVEGLMSHGTPPLPGDVVRATGWLAMGRPMAASVVEVRDGPLCPGKCAGLVDGARGYRLWLHRSFFDFTHADAKETALWVTMSQILACRNRLESSRTTVWLAGPARRLFGYYTDRRQVEGYISTHGAPDLRASVPRLAQLAAELGDRRALVLGLPFIPDEMGMLFVGYDWPYFPLQVYVSDTSVRRVF